MLSNNVHKPVKVLSSSPSAALAPGWFYDHTKLEGAYKSRYGCHIKPHVCGLDTLPAIRTAIRRATQTVEIVLWGFDPVVSVYGYSFHEHSNCTPETRTFSADHKIGNILLYAAERNLQVRMLLWDLGEIVSNTYRLLDYLEAAKGQMGMDTLLARERRRRNGEKLDPLPVEDGTPRFLMEAPDKAINWEWLFNLKVYPQLSPFLPHLTKDDWNIIRQEVIAPYKYRYTWFKKVEEKHGIWRNIEIRLTATAPEDLTKFLVEALRDLLNDFSNSDIMTLLTMPAYVQQMILEWIKRQAGKAGGDIPTFLRQNYPTHHQKIVLVDYEDPESANALVMGNNIRETDVDSFPHIFDRPEEGGRYPGELEFLTKVNRKCLFDNVQPKFTSIIEKLVAKGFLSNTAEAVEMANMLANPAFDLMWQRFEKWAPVPRPPRQDISCSVRGPVLYDINKHFTELWHTHGGAGFRKNSSLTPESFTLPKDTPLGTAQFSVTRLLDNKLGPIFSAYETAFKTCTRYVYFENQYFRSKDIADILVKHTGTRFENESQKDGEPIYYFAVVNKVDPYGMGKTHAVMKTLGHEEQMPQENRAQMVKERDKLLAANTPKDDECIKDLNKRIDQADTLIHTLNQGEKGTSPGNLENPEDAFKLRQAHSFLKGHIGTMMVCKYAMIRNHDDTAYINGYVYEDVNIHSKLLLADDVFAIIGSANMHDRGLMSDAESVIGTTQPGLALELRKKLFYNLTEQISKDDDPAKTIYDCWKDIMDANWRSRRSRAKLTGTLNYLYVYNYTRYPDMD